MSFVPYNTRRSWLDHRDLVRLKVTTAGGSRGIVMVAGGWIGTAAVHFCRLDDQPDENGFFPVRMVARWQVSKVRKPK